MTKRCFIALALPQEVRWELENLIAGLEKANQNCNIKFVNPRQAHITLHFLGDLTTKQIEAVIDILKQQTEKLKATEIITGQISAWPDLKQPQTIYLECREVNSNCLTKLQSAIGAELKSAGLEVDDRKWQPHITLARIKGPCRFKTEGMELSELSISLDQVDFLESRLTGTESDYKIIETNKLPTSQLTN